MPTDAETRHYGAVFDTVAAQYDRNRPTYPAEIVDRACETAGLTAGDRVLEIGCGTGQLTRDLVARGLHVTAVEPGANLIELAGRNLHGAGTVEFIHSRFEAAAPGARFAAVFSASAIHWIDPDVGWGKIAQSLAPGGVLALIQHSALRHAHIATDDDALMSVLAQAAPELAAGWPPLRDLETILSGVEDRRENVSEVWGWLGHPAVARPDAAALFLDVQIAAVPMVAERTADELNALLRTTSLFPRLTPSQQEALERGNREIEERVGRPIRAGMAAMLVTARGARGPGGL
jgi:SAM-dependent methyltransferase